MESQVYLHDIPLPEAFEHLWNILRLCNMDGILGAEEIPLDEQAVARVLAESIWAKISSPHYHASAMDGFCVRSSDTNGADTNLPMTLLCGEIKNNPAAAYLDTGDPIPDWADAVLPIENVEPLEPNEQPAPNPRKPYAIRIRAAITPWSHIRPMGEDMVATQLVLPSGHRLRPFDLGAAAACGHASVKVARKPRVAILPTGTELVPAGTPVKSGEIIEFNSIVLAGQIREWGGVATRFPILPDDFQSICEAVRQAAKSHDLILLNAGSSAGSEDYSYRVIEELGRVFVHGIALRPGHPVIIGMVSSGDSNLSRLVPILGVPGYPVSAALTGEIFVEPVISHWLGCKPRKLLVEKAILTRKVTSPPGDDDYMRVVVGRVGERLLAAPLPRGSGVITSLVRADGLVIVPRGTQGYPAEAQVEVHLYRSLQELEQTIFAIGSHDVCLDLLAQFLAVKGMRLVSANVGSQGGLVALKRNEAHLAGSHLLDPTTGIYNIASIKRYLAGISVKVIGFVGRKQGLMVLKGNPKGITSLHDLVRPDINFVNRQRGAGTRVLLDYKLSQLGIAPEQMHGYNHEEFTHLAVAASISSGRADCGLGIAAAAQALNLDFIPLFDEQYDLVVPEEYFSSKLLTPVWEILANPEFQMAVSALPGYDVSKMGKIIWEIE
jgi:putative molybdopterin biosynthesis protein